MRTVLDRLGFRPGMTAQAWRVPEALGEVLAPLAEAGGGEVGFRIAFVPDRAELAVAAAEVAAAYRAGGHLWLCYPKKSGRLRTDLTRDVGWEPIHALGLLGVAQVAGRGLVGPAVPAARGDRLGDAPDTHRRSRAGALTRRAFRRRRASAGG